VCLGQQCRSVRRQVKQLHHSYVPEHFSFRYPPELQTLFPRTDCRGAVCQMEISSIVFERPVCQSRSDDPSDWPTRLHDVKAPLKSQLHIPSFFIAGCSSLDEGKTKHSETEFERKFVERTNDLLSFHLHGPYRGQRLQYFLCLCKIEECGLLGYESKALVRTDVSEKCIASIFSVRREAHPRSQPEYSESCNPQDRGGMFFRNVGSYYSHTSSHPTRQYPSFPLLLPMSLAAGTFTEPLPSNGRRCNTSTWTGGRDL
jgi:hypothetical protein